MSKIFIVEDEKTIRDELSIFLSRYGYQIEAPDNFENVIENIKEIGSNVPSYISSIEDFINNILEKDDVSKFINTAGIKVNIDMYIDKHLKCHAF